MVPPLGIARPDAPRSRVPTTGRDRAPAIQNRDGASLSPLSATDSAAVPTVQSGRRALHRRHVPAPGLRATSSGHRALAVRPARPGHNGTAGWPSGACRTIKRCELSWLHGGAYITRFVRRSGSDASNQVVSQIGGYVRDDHDVRPEHRTTVCMFMHSRSRRERPHLPRVG